MWYYNRHFILIVFVFLVSSSLGASNALSELVIELNEQDAVNCSVLSFTPIAEGGGDNTDPNTSINNLNDGDSSSDSRWSRFGDGAYVDLALNDGQQLVSSLEIAWAFGNTRSSNFDILVSTDGVNFTAVSNGSSGNFNSSGTTADLETFAFAEVSASYVRIIGHGNTNNEWTSISEVEIISCNSIPTACPNNIIENTNPIPNGIYHASSSVFSSGGVSGSGIVEMKAGNFIQLDTPFEVDLSLIHI